MKTRFIPACAGNTVAAVCVHATDPVHPRVRGEHSSNANCTLNCDGSSPRARGTQLADGRGLGRQRFIPACAGNTREMTLIGKSELVHPRVRGEHIHVSAVSSHSCGSSPRARGTRPAAPGNADSSRFIPACAGNTSAAAPSSTFDPVHPRVRGEHFDLALPGLQERGSSPRARGTPERIAPAGKPSRFIPACAGNTSSLTLTCGTVSVHPRVRGEHTTTDLDDVLDGGSSPRARGTPSHRTAEPS